MKKEREIFLIFGLRTQRFFEREELIGAEET